MSEKITKEEIISFLENKKIKSNNVYKIGLDWIEKLGLEKESRWSLEGRIRTCNGNDRDFKRLLIAFLVDTVNTVNKSVIYHSDPIRFEYKSWHIKYEDILV